MIAAMLLSAAVASGQAIAPGRLARLDAAVSEAIAARELPGAVVLVGQGRRVLYRKAFGDRAVEPVREPETPDTVFDIASLTKCVATAPSILILVEEGRIRLGDPVTRYIPEFAAGGGERSKVTVEQLLTHRAGFPPDDPIELYTGTPEEIFARKFREPLRSRPGSEFVYSDVGYEVLGEIVRRVSGERLDVFAEKRIFRPLGMADTEFRPLQRAGEYRIPSSRIAPTEQREGRSMRGEVHDPRAYAVGGVAGHAGVFSTADDLAKFCRMILGGGTLGGVRVLSPLSVEALTRPRFYGDGDVRALGFDIDTAFSNNRGDLFPRGSFGHTGFTGTGLWIDPASRTFVVFLSNRVHPDGKGNIVRVRAIVATVFAAAIAGDSLPASRRLAAAVPGVSRSVLAGIDVLALEEFRPIAGKRVGLVTNATGVARDGRSTIDVLSSAAARKAGVRLVRLFSPEHGLRTDADAPVASGKDPATSLPVVSLYGDRRRPLPSELADLDALVLDIQDVGARFYTYTTTGGYLLEEVAKAKIPLVVLDRPDPVGGAVVEGPLADPEKLSFTAYASIPVRYGMTTGELLGLFNSENRIGAKLEVVRMRGWTRALWYDETGLEWINPSPNMRSLTGAALYPGVGLLEPTNVSVGRGTDTPFELVGAPWIDGRRLSAYLSARRIPGVRFTPVHFTPTASVHQGTPCGGIRIDVVDREALRSLTLGIELIGALRALFPGDWDRAKLGALLANAATLVRIEAGEPPDQIVASWKSELAAFERERARHLLY